MTIDLDPVALRETLNKLRTSETGPPPFICTKTTRPFLILHVLEQNESDCMLATSNKKLVFLRSNGKKLTEKYLNEQRPLIKEAYDNCKQHRRILIIPLFILAEGRIGHENMLIFNTVRNEVERFEPHGQTLTMAGVDNTSLNESIRAYINSLELPGNPTYVPQNELCPSEEGWQRIEAQVPRGIVGDGLTEAHYCCAWSFFWANMRLKYKRVSGRQLIEKINNVISNEPEKLIAFVRDQVRFLHKELHEAGDFVEYLKLCKLSKADERYIAGKKKYDKYYLKQFERFTHMMQERKKKKKKKKDIINTDEEESPQAPQRKRNGKREKDPVSDGEDEVLVPKEKKKAKKRIVGYDVMKIIQQKSLNDKQTVKKLEEVEFSPNAVDANGHKQLVIAVMTNKSKTVKYLLSKGAKINAKQRNGFTALSSALVQENWKMAKLLIQQGADLVEATKKAPEEVEAFKKTKEGKSLYKGG